MRPLNAAIIIAASFLIVALSYLFLSDEITRQLAANVEQYKELQSSKGVVFMVTVALGLFGLSYHFLSRIEDEAKKTQLDRESLFLMERRVLAGTLAACIVHDAKNLVGAIRANLQYVEHTVEPTEQLDEALEDSFDVVDELLDLIDRLRGAARAQFEEGREETDLAELVETSVSLIDAHTLLDNCAVEVEVPQACPVRAYPNLVIHAVINLVLNAARATGAEGQVRVRVTQHDDRTTLVVEDDGPGIPEDQHADALAPFSSTSPDNVGLGLFSVSYCATRHNGGVFIERSEKLGGARVRLEFDAPLLN